MNAKVDFKKSLDTYAARRGEFRVVDVPEQQYVKVDGQGDPNTSADYEAALSALYPVAYTLKFMSKRELGRDYVVPPLEGLWWAEDMDTFTVGRDKSQWNWTMMILVPYWLDRTTFERAIEAVRAKQIPSRLDDVKFKSFTEGTCVQTLHIGSFDDEGPVLEKMHHEFIPSQGYRLSGTHHEVYFSDPRKTAPEKLRTLLRQPVVRAQ